jgi:hypothetical protein
MSGTEVISQLERQKQYPHLVARSGIAKKQAQVMLDVARLKQHTSDFIAEVKSHLMDNSVDQQTRNELFHMLDSVNSDTGGVLEDMQLELNPLLNLLGVDVQEDIEREFKHKSDITIAKMQCGDIPTKLRSRDNEEYAEWFSLPLMGALCEMRRKRG